MRSRATGLAVALVLAACHRPSDDARTQDERIQNQARLLCLLPPGQESAADAALASAQDRARRVPEKVDNWIAAGRGWVQKARLTTSPGYYARAEGCADVVLAFSPEDSTALNLRGMVRLNEHRFAEARDIAQKLVNHHPQDPMAWGTLSDAYLELGKYDEAANAAQRMIDLKPNLPSYSRVAHLAWLHGDVAKAKDTIGLAIDSARGARDPEPGAWVVVQAAMIFWHQGDYEGAGVGFDQALTLLPEFPPALVGKARVAMALGRPADAAKLLSVAFSKSPLAETAWLLSDARRCAGDESGAVAAEAEVERIGRATDPRTLASFFATRNAHVDEAVRLAREERERRPDIYSEDALAWALYRAGRIEDARASSERAIRLGTLDARMLFHAGAIRVAAQDPSGIELLKRALKLNPHFEGAAEAAEIVDRAVAPRLAASDR
jgi:tetratricopeptide (TPR) repeat protein